MILFFQFDFPIIASMGVLFAMGVLSLVIYSYLHSKYLAVRKLPKNLSATYFSKTFNVFDPYLDQRKVIQISLIDAFPTLLFATIILSIIIAAEILATGTLLCIFTLIICVSLIALEETFDVSKNAKIFVDAIKNGSDLGEGDLRVLSIIRETLPKLKKYYLSLALIFFAVSIALPYILPSALMAFAVVITAPIGLAPWHGILVSYYPVLLLAFGTLIIQVMASKVKRMIFGFPEAASLFSLGKQFELMKLWVRWHMHELLWRTSPEPEEMQDSERRKV